MPVVFSFLEMEGSLEESFRRATWVSVEGWAVSGPSCFAVPGQEPIFAAASW